MKGDDNQRRDREAMTRRNYRGIYVGGVDVEERMERFVAGE